MSHAPSYNGTPAFKSENNINKVKNKCISFFSGASPLNIDLYEKRSRKLLSKMVSIRIQYFQVLRENLKAGNLVRDFSLGMDFYCKNNSELLWTRSEIQLKSSCTI